MKGKVALVTGVMGDVVAFVNLRFPRTGASPMLVVACSLFRLFSLSEVTLHTRSDSHPHCP